uniref:hydantoinase/carbamoylase family amidase n=1 Tax=Orrella sp. TaxID=1921583 RepID=UPI0040483E1F
MNNTISAPPCVSPDLAGLNTATVSELQTWLGCDPSGSRGAYAGAPWIAEAVIAHRPFASFAAFKYALTQVVQQSSEAAQLKLIQDSAPDWRAVLNLSLNPSLTASLLALLNDYQTKFGFPFVLAPEGPRGAVVASTVVNAVASTVVSAVGGGVHAVAESFALKPDEVLSTLQRRLGQPVEFERQESLREVHRIAELRLNALFGVTPELGNLVWDWCETLAAISEPGYVERGELTVTYLTAEHQACAAQLKQWMKEGCGFDSVTVDAVGNVVGVYHGQDPESPRLMTGSHFDTVRNGGKYDGRLGILVPMACVRELSRQGKRLPFGIEVVAFSEEEGQRYKAVFLGSGALTGAFNNAWLDQTDAQGISMRQAMADAGLNIDDIPSLKRDPAKYLGFVEVHIEQGPVLNSQDLPLGVVTSINGGLRLLGEIEGMASHAGTTPMTMRNDAAAGVAELILYLEERASSVPDLVGTVGQLEVPNGSINVIPGRCRFSLDIRATTDEVRNACAEDVKAALARICQKRGLRGSVEEIMRVAAAPSDPIMQGRWERSVAGLGLPVFCMPSGAGHDAMKLHDIMPQAMLFMRGLNAGISHNPLESITNDDTELCVRAFEGLLQQLTQELNG